MISAGISPRDAPSWHLQPSLHLKTWSFTFVVVLLWLQNGFPSSSKSQWKNKERKVSVPCPCYPKRKRMHMLVSFLLTLLSERGGGNTTTAGFEGDKTWSFVQDKRCSWRNAVKWAWLLGMESIANLLLVGPLLRWELASSPAT